jgi:protein-disulfide isomerase
MNVKDTVLNWVTALTGICALVVTIHAIRSAPGTPVAAAAAPSRHVSSSEWKPLLVTGHRFGPADAKLTMIEFADFQCPVCGAFESVIDSMRARHPRDFAVVFHQFPLSYHPLAMPLARASECAATQGRFHAFHDTVFADQHALGVIPVLAFGTRAGISDTARFRRCVLDTSPVPAITRDLASVKRLQIPGTPAVIVNGTLRTGYLTLHDLERMLYKP